MSRVTGHMRWLAGGLLAAAATVAGAQSQQSPQSISVRAEGEDSRIDVIWSPPSSETVIGYNIYRADAADGPFKKLNDEPHRYTVYGDFLGRNGVSHWYRVAAVDAGGSEMDMSATVSATTRAMATDDLLTSIQKAHFRYFWDFGHPVSGLAREGFDHDWKVCTSGGTGFGLMTIMVGAERGFVSREDAARRVLKIIAFLEDKAQRYHGAWSHWIDGGTGETIPFVNKNDDGGDLAETAYLVQGMLTVAQYFDRDDPVEKEIRQRVDRLWRGVEWTWYLREPDGERLLWHWSPNYGWAKNHHIGGHFNECQIVYILAISSPTHAIPADRYYRGWTGDPPTRYVNGNEYFGQRLAVGFPYGGPLFFTQYSYIGLDPRAITDRYTNYFDNNRAITLINHAHCVANPGGFKGYSDLVWGLTASTSIQIYAAHEPRHDNGTISPTAALSAMPYAPELSIATLKYFYYDLGEKIWGDLGFYDAFNLDKDWVSRCYLAIDQGPVAPMIENYRTRLCWRTFMQNQDILRGLEKAAILTPKYSPEAALPALSAGQPSAEEVLHP